jgi:diguanylate cyclase (GGDEF)-like protein/PAS domain S-box-containing protein
MADETLPAQSLEQTLREQELIFAHAGVGIVFIQDRKVKRCNDHYAQMHGHASAQTMIGMDSRALYADERDYNEVGVQAYALMRHGESYKSQIRMRRTDDSTFWCRLTGSLIDPTDADAGSIWIIDDIDDLYQAEQSLKQALIDQQLIFDHAMVGIVFLSHRRVERCNGRFEELFGYGPGALQGASSRQWYLTDEDWRAAGDRCYEPFSKGLPFQGEMLLGRRDGTPIWCEVRAKSIYPDDITRGSIWITMDISERKRAQLALEAAQADLERQVQLRTEELRSTVDELHREIAERQHAQQSIKHMAEHDGLTGMANRALLEERLKVALDHARQTGRLVAVLFIDLDRFKNVNDVMGHDAGDILLKSVAQRLQQAVRASDTVARFGGDEFVILMTGSETSAGYQKLAQRVHHALRQPVRIGVREINVSASIGISVYPQDGQDAADLLKNADVAMYHAKDNGRNQTRYFNAQLAGEHALRIELEQALHGALRHGQFELRYQPQVCMGSGAIIGAEALLRWQRPGHGLVMPGDFIRLAEETGTIREIGHWVLNAACQQGRAWQDAGWPALRVSVNVSAVQLANPEFCEQVFQSLESSGLPAQLLELELTESVLIAQVDHNLTMLQRLHQRGIRLSIDDFGTGYSSLSCLRRLPLDALKIDRSFVADIVSNPDDAVLCRTIASMARNLALAVTAEGVETAEQLHLLREFGCDSYQGYLFSRPVPADVFERLLRAPG